MAVNQRKCVSMDEPYGKKKETIVFHRTEEKIFAGATRIYHRIGQFSDGVRTFEVFSIEEFRFLPKENQTIFAICEATPFTPVIFAGASKRLTRSELNKFFKTVTMQKEIDRLDDELKDHPKAETLKKAVLASLGHRIEVWIDDILTAQARYGLVCFEERK